MCFKGGNANTPSDDGVPFCIRSICCLLAFAEVNVGPKLNARKKQNKSKLPHAHKRICTHTHSLTLCKRENMNKEENKFWFIFLKFLFRNAFVSVAGRFWFALFCRCANESSAAGNFAGGGGNHATTAIAAYSFVNITELRFLCVLSADECFFAFIIVRIVITKRAALPVANVCLCVV